MLLAPLLALLAAAPDADVAELEVEVRTLGTREPIPLAQIERVDSDFRAEADLDGKVTLTLEPGLATLKISAPGFAPRQFQELLLGGERVSVIYRLEPRGPRRYETIVNSSRFRTETARVALSSEEAHDAAGTGGEPLRAVLLLPGVAPIVSGLSYPVVRGAQPAATAFFLDDVRVPQLFHALVGPAVVHPALVDRVDFFAGAPPVRFGRLMSGAVEAQLRRPRERGFGAEVSLDLLNASALAELSLPGAGTAVSLAGRYSYTGLIGAAIARTLLPSDPPRTPVANFWDYQLRVEQKLGPVRIRLLALGAADEIGARADTPTAPSGFFVSEFHRVDLKVITPAPGGELELGATAGPERLGVFGDDGEIRSFEFVLTRSVYGGRLRYRAELTDTWKLESGLDFESQITGVSLLGKTTDASTPVNDFREPSTTGWLGSTWVQLGYAAGPLKATLGLRGDAYHLDPDVTLGSFAPRVELRGQLTPTLEGRASIGLVNQPPTVLLNLPVADLGGLRLGLQRGVQSEVGLKLHPAEAWVLDGALFHQELFRAIEYGLEDLVDTRRAIDHGGVGTTGRAFGLELTARKLATGRWFGWLSLTLMRSERLQTVYQFDSAGEPAGAPEQRWVPFAFDQTLLINSTVGVRLPRGWQVGLSAHFHTGRPESGQLGSRAMERGTDPATGEASWVPIPLDRVPRLPAFFRLDLRVSKQWRFDDFVLEAFLDVLNASFSREVLAYTYGATRVPIDFPVVLPQLGLKASY